MGPDSFQWCPATGQGAMGTNWSLGSSIWTGGRASSLWGWRSPGPGCPGRLWSLLLWRYSRTVWTGCCAACSGWPCLGRGVGLNGPQRSLPTPTILWFCNYRDSAPWQQSCSAFGLPRLVCFPGGWLAVWSGGRKSWVNWQKMVKQKNFFHPPL